MNQVLDDARRRALLQGVLVFVGLLAFVACVTFTREGRPISSSSQDRYRGDTGRPFGRLWITYYWLVEQRDYPGTLDTQLFDKACRPLATVSAAFSDELCVEGSGRLSDGRVVNYASTCACGRDCPNGGRVCYEELPPEDFPWGKGSRANPLKPLRSIATDPRLIPFGTLLYVAAFDGATIPKHGELGGFVHDGCFRADDVGTSIEGTHIDIFAGSETLWQFMETVVKTHEDITISLDPPRCAETFR
jgi:3D (Asp-Asp-Asp) domain-containing protein